MSSNQSLEPCDTQGIIQWDEGFALNSLGSAQLALTGQLFLHKRAKLADPMDIASQVDFLIQEHRAKRDAFQARSLGTLVAAERTKVRPHFTLILPKQCAES